MSKQSDLFWTLHELFLNSHILFKHRFLFFFPLSQQLLLEFNSPMQTFHWKQKSQLIPLAQQLVTELKKKNTE